mmetsp:Transcript_38513/g.92029  ORF Transcript_38513/g.92029 Transcript_38513/m.92029 type:complete len:204 (-) Transcript_38513:269-880(-)
MAVAAVGAVAAMALRVLEVHVGDVHRDHVAMALAVTLRPGAIHANAPGLASHALVVNRARIVLLAAPGVGEIAGHPPGRRGVAGGRGVMHPDLRAHRGFAGCMGAAPGLLLLRPPGLPVVEVQVAIPQHGSGQEASNRNGADVALLLAGLQGEGPLVRRPAPALVAAHLAVKAALARVRLVPLRGAFVFHVVAAPLQRPVRGV